MADVQETIPEPLGDDVNAALAWFNGTQETEFEVTGIVDPDASLASSGTTGAARELHLVLCGGDLCQQKSFRVSRSNGSVDVSLLGGPEPAPGTVQPELDPPPGARRSWLDARLAEHAFVVLVFYRGFW